MLTLYEHQNNVIISILAFFFFHIFTYGIVHIQYVIVRNVIRNYVSKLLSYTANRLHMLWEEVKSSQVKQRKAQEKLNVLYEIQLRHNHKRANAWNTYA